MYTYGNKTIYHLGEKGSGTHNTCEVQIYDDLKKSFLNKRNATGQKILYTDVNFPASERSIAQDVKAFNEYFNQIIPDITDPVSMIKWKRPFHVFTNPKPKFIVDGATRSDVNQGFLGDCWMLASMSTLPFNEKFFSIVVPTDNKDFENPDYCGIFHFRIWHFGNWIDVVVDDFLPFVEVNGKDHLLFNKSAPAHELWSPLLEKAYAKLKGNYYDALTAGQAIESQVDFTGGIGYSIDLDLNHTEKELQKNLFKMMDKNHRAGSIIACSIPGHQLSITNVVELSPPNIKETTRLIRIRDPYGKNASVEWKGAWSDGSKEWNQLSPDVLEKLEYTNKMDGEYWMPFEDFLVNFTTISFVFLSPNDVSDELESKKWEMSEVKGKWIKGITAGGSLECCPDTYHMNPQYKIILEKPDAGNDCNLIVSLLQECDRANKRSCTSKMPFIGFKVYDIRNSLIEPLTAAFLADETKILNSKYHSFGNESMYEQVREQTGWFSIKSGEYMIIPAIDEPNIEGSTRSMEGSFLLRIYVDVHYKFTAVHCESEGCKVAPPKVVHDEL